MNKFAKEIFYEIYPTSYYDSNNDGIGDLNGITSKLDYLQDLGITGVWLNPFYLSPFRDGGYDVKDFFKVDPRFGDMDDLKTLLKEAHKRNIKIILDLIPGHASEENADFLRSAEPERNEKSDLFVWNASVWELEPGYRLISGRHQRNGCYMVNFFAVQPAFNFGFYNIEYPKWQIYYKDERVLGARQYIINIIRFYLEMGVDGFRVDMADSLVKNDPDRLGTIEVWRYLFNNVRPDYPDAIFIAEWSYPHRAFAAGFDVDFVLDHWDNFSHRFARSNEQTRGTSALNGGDLSFFLRDLNERIYESYASNGLLGIISGNHDTPRIADSLDEQRLRLFYMFMYSLPGVPFLYYGDEIMMKTAQINSKDGGFYRTGSRTPMQWDHTKNAGFSKTDKELYLPVFKANENVLSDALNDEKSLYHFIKKLIALRKSNDDLTMGEYDVSEFNRLIIIKRNNTELHLNLSNNILPLPAGEILLKSDDNLNELKPYTGVIVRK